MSTGVALCGHPARAPDHRPRNRPSVSGADMVIHIASVGAGFLWSARDGTREVRCALRSVMAAFAEWTAGRGGCRGQKLAVAAVHVGFCWPGSAHGAIHDCAATMAVWHWLRSPRQVGVGGGPSHVQGSPPTVPTDSTDAVLGWLGPAASRQAG
jgi:hypothetical protein